MKSEKNIPERRPSVFIGSSREGQAIAEAIQLNLDQACEVVVWNQGIFGLSKGTLESLVESLDDFDFAILVLTPDDLIEGRGEKSQSPRDNVLLELGLFIGALGRNRTFVVYDRTANLRLPTDLAGVTAATWQPHASGNLQASLGAPCTQIKGAISQLGIRKKVTLSVSITQTTQFQIISDLLEEVAKQFFILMYEKQIALDRESIWDMVIPYEYDKANRCRGTGAFIVDSLCRKLADAELLTQDLRNKVSLTERGRDFAIWLVERGHKVDYFSTQVGGWGERPPRWNLKNPPPPPKI